MKQKNRVAPVIAMIFAIMLLGVSLTELDAQPAGTQPATETAPVAVALPPIQGELWSYKGTEGAESNCQCCCDSTDVITQVHPECPNLVRYGWNPPGSNPDPGDPITGLTVQLVEGNVVLDTWYGQPINQWYWFPDYYEANVNRFARFTTHTQSGASYQCEQPYETMGITADVTLFCATAKLIGGVNGCDGWLTVTAPILEDNTSSYTIYMQVYRDGSLYNDQVVNSGQQISFTNVPGGTYTVYFTATSPCGEDLPCQPLVKVITTPPPAIIIQECLEAIPLAFWDCTWKYGLVVGYANGVCLQGPLTYSVKFQANTYNNVQPGDTIMVNGLSPQTGYNAYMTVSSPGAASPTCNVPFVTPADPDPPTVTCAQIAWQWWCWNGTNIGAKYYRPANWTGCFGHFDDWKVEVIDLATNQTLYTSPWQSWNTPFFQGNPFANPQGIVKVVFTVKWNEGFEAICDVQELVDPAPQGTCMANGTSGGPNAGNCSATLSFPDIFLTCGDPSLLSGILHLYRTDLPGDPEILTLPIGVADVITLDTLSPGTYRHSFTILYDGESFLAEWQCQCGCEWEIVDCNPCNYLIPADTLFLQFVGDVAIVTGANFGAPAGSTFGSPTGSTELEYDCDDLGTHQLVIYLPTGEDCEVEVTILDTGNPSVGINGNTFCADLDPGDVFPNLVPVDNCEVSSVELISINGNPSTPLGVGVYHFNYLVTDGSGNSTTNSITIVVEDCNPCDEIGQSYTVELDVNGEGAVTVDDYGAPEGHFSSPTGPTFFNVDCEDLGVHTIEIYVPDNTGQMVPCEVQLIVVDLIDPTISVPADTEECVGFTFSQLPAPVTNDNCNGETWTSSIADPNFVFTMGATTITYTVTDASGNTATGTTVVTIVDCYEPTPCPGDLTPCEPVYCVKCETDSVFLQFEGLCEYFSFATVEKNGIIDTTYNSVGIWVYPDEGENVYNLIFHYSDNYLPHEMEVPVFRDECEETVNAGGTGLTVDCMNGICPFPGQVHIFTVDNETYWETFTWIDPNTGQWTAPLPKNRKFHAVYVQGTGPNVLWDYHVDWADVCEACEFCNLCPAQILAADVNQDGIVNYLDQSLIVKVIEGDTVFVANWFVEPGYWEFETGEEDIMGLNFVFVKAGDANLSASSDCDYENAVPSNLPMDGLTSGQRLAQCISAHDRETGKASSHQAQDLVVYPNPNSGQFFVRWNGAVGFSLHVFDVNGKEVRTVSHFSQTVGFAVSPGTYFISATDVAGNRLGNPVKVVVQ